MSAKTRQAVPNSNEQIVRLDELHFVAKDLIQKGARSNNSVMTLLRILQLFKENKLHPTSLDSSPADENYSRKRFLDNLKDYGEVDAFRSLMDELPTRVSNPLAEHFGQVWGGRPLFRRPLMTLLSSPAETITDIQGIGPKALTQLNQVLADRGLKLGMNDQEIREIFQIS